MSFIPKTEPSVRIYQKRLNDAIIMAVRAMNRKEFIMMRVCNKIRKIPLLLLMLVLFLPVSVCMADGQAAVVEVCTNETDVSLYVKNVGSSLTEITAQIGISASSQVTCQSIEDTAFETLILIDNSLSIPKDMRSRTAEFLESFLAARATNEKVAIGVFSRDITYLADFTSDDNVLQQAVSAISYQNQDTYITDMLYELLRDDYIGNKRDVYRRIIIIADGVDNESLGYTVDELKQLIREDTYPIYTIGCQTSSNGTELENLFSLSRQSNGAYFLMETTEDITAVVEALGKDREIVKVVVTPPAELLDGSVKSVKLNFSGQSVYGEVRMPQQEMEVEIETIGSETATVESSVAESEEHTEEETSTVDEEALRKAAAKKFIFIVIVVWIFIIAAFLTVIVVLRYKKKQNRELANAQNLIEQRKRELRDALPGEINIVLTDIHIPEKSFQVSLDPEIIVGRSGDCRIVLDYDRSISGKHCAIDMREHKVMVRDLGSTNGTSVNGKRVLDRTELKHGDILVLGQLEMKVGIIHCERTAK